MNVAKRNQLLFEKLANFELKPQDVAIPLTNYVLKRMPFEISTQLAVFANTHLRACQYVDYDPESNPDPGLSFWNSVYYAQLGQIEDYECPECEDCDTPEKAISSALLLGIGVAIGGVVAASQAGGLLLSGGATPFLLPAATPYIDVVGTVFKVPSASYPAITLQTPQGSYPIFPINATDWSEAAIGSGFSYRALWNILNPAQIPINSIGTGGQYGHTAYITLSNGDNLPMDAIVRDVAF